MRIRNVRYFLASLFNDSRRIYDQFVMLNGLYNDNDTTAKKHSDNIHPKNSNKLDQ